MNNNKSIFIPLIISIFNLVLLTIGHYYSISLLVLLSLLCFSILIILADIKLVFPLLLFHLAWSPLLKLDASAISFLTLITIPIIFRLALGIKKEVNISPFFTAAFFIIFILIVRFARMAPIQTNFLNFIVLLILTTLLLVDRKNHSDFRVCVIYYTIGLILSCLASYLVSSSPGMQQFITLNQPYDMTGTMILRRSGLTPDSNFFAAQILIAITCLMILLRNIKSFLYMFLYCFLIGVLLYFGLASVSKMFLFSIGIIGLVGFLSMVISNKIQPYKIGMFFLVVFLMIVIIKSQLFSSLINAYALRLAQATDLETLTTGRSHLQLFYFDYICNNIDVLLFGQGFTYKILASAGNDMHNTFIEILYEAGIIGFLLLGVWYKAVDKISIPNHLQMSWINKSLFYMFLLAYFLPWFALDMVFFDEFFYFLILMTYLKNFLLSNNYSVRANPGTLWIGSNNLLRNIRS